MVNVKEVELTTLWGRVIEEVAINAPQHRAFLQFTIKNGKAGDKVGVSWKDNKGDTRTDETTVS